MPPSEGSPRLPLRVLRCPSMRVLRTLGRPGGAQASRMANASLWMQRVFNGVGGLLFLALFGVFLIQIVARFGLNKPLPWTDEAAVILYVWVILWAAALVVPEREHVVFDLVWNAVSPGARRIMKLLGNAMVGTLAAIAIPVNWDYVQFMARESTPVLGLPFMAVFVPFVLLLASLVIRSAWAICQALHGQGLDAGQVGEGRLS